MPESSSTMGYLTGILWPQLAHLPRSHIHEISGTLWNHLIFLPQDGQWLGFVAMLRFLGSSCGSLWINTLAKEPNTKPKGAKNQVSAKGEKSATGM
jgi:hypothetical protein